MSVFVDRDKCKGCGICVSICPVQAVSIVDEKAFIDQKSCTACPICMDECPTNAIRQTFEKEIHLTKSEPLLPDSSKLVILPAPESSPVTRWSQNTGKKDPMYINRLIRAVDRLFEFGPSPGIRGKGKRGRRRRQRGRHKGRRF